MRNFVEYIIVGDGYAGLFLAHQLYKEGKTFCIFSENRKGASQVSAGIVNPVVLKKFTTFWKAQEQIDFLLRTLIEFESYTGRNYFIPDQIERVFHDGKEKELWLKKSENADLKPFLSREFGSLSSVKNDFGTGKVMQSGRLDVRSFFNDMRRFFSEKVHLINEKFDYEHLQTEDNSYKNLSFDKIIFCEGIGVKDNPFFCDIPVQPNKGHHLKVQLSTPVDDNVIIKKKHFLFSLEDHTYYYGGTYDRDQFDDEIDQHAVDQLRNGLSEIFPNEFEMKEVQFGFRPTVKDRRPLIGSHKVFKNFFVFNGLGARGILNGCFFARHLFEHIEFGADLHPEVNLNRFL